MCMTLALSAPGVGLVATDTRYSSPGGVFDYGQRLRRIPGGWAAATGNTGILLYGLRALEQVGAGDPAASRKALRAAAQAIRSRVPGKDLHETAWLIARECEGVFSIHSARENGDDHDPADSRSGKWAKLVTWPGGVLDSGSDGEADAGLVARVRGARTLWDILRAVGWTFAFASDRCSTMSSEVEIGFTNSEGAFYLRRPAAWIASAPDALLRGSLSAPPQPGPFPQLAGERLVFRPVAAA